MISTKSERSAAAPAQDHPCRHGRLLCVGRAARRSRAPGQAGRGRRPGPRRGDGRLLRGAQIWRPLGDAVGDRQAPLPRFDAYRAVSHQIRAIFLDYTPLVEPLSLDEAYLDVTEDLKGIGVATRVAEEIRARIRAETGLTASAGVSYNKFIAKLASDHNKPDGLCVVPPAKGEAFVAGLAVKRFHGIGPKTAEKMARLGIVTGADLRAQSLAFLAHNFGSSGDYYYNLARGICHRQVRPDRPYKSIGAEDTFLEDLIDEADLVAELDRISQTVWRRIEDKAISGRTVTLKVKFFDFQILTRAKSLDRAVAGREEFLDIGCALLRTLIPLAKSIRLLGLTLSNLSEGEERTEPLELELPL